MTRHQIIGTVSEIARDAWTGALVAAEYLWSRTLVAAGVMRTFLEAQPEPIVKGGAAAAGALILTAALALLIRARRRRRTAGHGRRTASRTPSGRLRQRLAPAVPVRGFARRVAALAAQGVPAIEIARQTRLPLDLVSLVTRQLATAAAGKSRPVAAPLSPSTSARPRVMRRLLAG